MVDPTATRRRRTVPGNVGTIGLLEIDLTGLLGVAAHPSHLNVALERRRRTHEVLVLVQTFLESRSNHQVVLSDVDHLGDLLAVRVLVRIEHAGVTGEVVGDLRLEIFLDVHGLGCVVRGHELEQLDKQSSSMMRILRAILLDEVPQSIRPTRRNAVVDVDVPPAETLRRHVLLVGGFERVVREKISLCELVAVDLVVAIAKEIN